MLAKFFLKKVVNKSLLRMTFATKTEGLKNMLKQEIEYEEKNYSPVDKSEMTQFYKSSGFTFVEKENSPRMELTKTSGDYEVIVSFLAKPPIPQQEGEQQDQQNEKGK